MENGIGVVEPGANQSTCDGFCHILCDCRAEMAERPHVIVGRLTDCVNMPIHGQRRIKSDSEDLDVRGQGNETASNID
jgi:hypothetical protein